MIATDALTQVRHPDGIWEVPTEVWGGNVLPKLDCDWVWIVRDPDRPRTLAVLVTAPMHGAVLLVRLWKEASAPAMMLRELLKKTAEECMNRGMLGWVCQVSGTNVTELKLARMMLRFGGQHYPVVGLYGYGKLEDVCRKLS